MNSDVSGETSVGSVLLNSAAARVIILSACLYFAFREALRLQKSSSFASKKGDRDWVFEAVLGLSMIQFFKTNFGATISEFCR